MAKFLKEAEGRSVYLPDGNRWPAEGALDPETYFTRRRIADGDLVEANPPAKGKAAEGDSK